MKCRKMPIYETDSQGRKSTRLSRKFYAVFQDYSGVLRRLPLFDDRKASDEAARKVDRLNDLRAGGESMPPELSRWVEMMPNAVRTKLAAWGILSGSKVAGCKPLSDHLADWKAAILAKGNTVHHADTSHNRAKRIIDDCRFIHWTDLSAGKVRQYLADLRTGEHDLSAASFNYYTQAIKGFCRWMVRDGRAQENPVMHLQQVNTRADRRHDRRALSTDELRQLLDCTERAGEIHGMGGTDRAMLYRLAVESGLRAGEIRSLTRGSFQFDGDAPTVTIAAAYAKNRREDSLPLKADTVAALRTHLAGKMPGAIAFNLPGKCDVIRMLKADLATARAAWIADATTGEDRAEREKSSFLAYTDDAGRKADFDALRHTFISNLVAGGVHPKSAQTLARHSTITLTMDRYSHSYRGQLADALNTLPDLSPTLPQTAKATGTHDATAVPREATKPPSEFVSPGLSPGGEFAQLSVESGGVKADRIQSAQNTGKQAQNALFSSDKSTFGPLAELADAMDSKSIFRKEVPVQLRQGPFTKIPRKTAPPAGFPGDFRFRHDPTKEYKELESVMRATCVLIISLKSAARFAA